MDCKRNGIEGTHSAHRNAPGQSECTGERNPYSQAGVGARTNTTYDHLGANNPSLRKNPFHQTTDHFSVAASIIVRCSCQNLIAINNGH
jgi:hypothetical protein